MLCPFRQFLIFRAPGREEIREFGKGEGEMKEDPDYIKKEKELIYFEAISQESIIGAACNDNGSGRSPCHTGFGVRNFCGWDRSVYEHVACVRSVCRSCSG